MDINLRESRISAIKIIYNCEMTNDNIGIASSKVLEEDDTVAIKLAMNVINNKEKIDNLISECLTNYKINRLNAVDRAIIELCTSELLDGVVPNICINEALEITRIYTDNGDNKAVKFNNKVLDTIKNKIERKD